MRLIQPRHLPTLLTLCARHPRLPVVIDHAAKPAIAHGLFQPWANDIARVAQQTAGGLQAVRPGHRGRNELANQRSAAGY